MNPVGRNRRAFVLGAGAIGMSQLLPQAGTAEQSAKNPGYVLGPAEGEPLIHFRDHGRITIRASSATGSDRLAFGTQQVMKGSGIPVHRHINMDEAFYVLDGGGVCLLNDDRHSFENGSTIFIAQNSWHGFENPEHELLLLWIMAPPGLDGFFRETCSPPGAPPKGLTREQIREIARKYGTEFR
jgi:quercetin dioxygenase-like cupin family protein